MSRFRHAIKHNKGTEGPSSMVFVDTETFPYCISSETNTIRHKLRLGVAIYGRYIKGQITRREVFTFKTANHFWEWIRTKTSKSRPLYIFAHNLLFDLRILDTVNVIKNNNPRRWTYILRNGCNIVGGELVNGRIWFVDTINYFRCSLAELGGAFGLAKLQMPSFTAAENDWFEYCLRDVLIIERAILTIRQYLEENDCGTFKRTISGCSYHAWRHRFYNRNVYIHDNDEAINLEGLSYFGGRCECYRIGTYGGKLFLVDCNSLYPYVMKRYAMPVKLVSIHNKPDTDWVRRQLDYKSACAQVIIDTKYPVYPKRIGDRTRYPIGVFRTWLCKPELQIAIDCGNVYAIEKLALYESANIFKDFVDFFHAQRLKFKHEGNGAMELVAKLLLNSLSGKFAQRVPKWVERTHITPEYDWGIFGRYDKCTERTTWYRTISGLAQEDMGSDFGPNSFPAISGHITSFARCIMESYKGIAGIDNVYYMDTDSMIVNEEGIDNLLLRRLIHKDELGLLKLVETGDYVTIKGTKDYTIGGKSVIGAVRHDATKIGNDDYKQWIWDGVTEALSCKLSSSVAQHLRVIRVRHDNLRHRTRSDGVVMPIECMELLELVSPR